MIVVGDLRDGETARAALEAAAVGYFVLATTSAVTVSDAVARLVEAGKMASSLRLPPDIVEILRKTV